MRRLHALRDRLPVGVHLDRGGRGPRSRDPEVAGPIHDRPHPLLFLRLLRRGLPRGRHPDGHRDPRGRRTEPRRASSTRRKTSSDEVRDADLRKDRGHGILRRRDPGRRRRDVRRSSRGPYGPKQMPARRREPGPAGPELLPHPDARRASSSPTRASGRSSTDSTSISTVQRRSGPRGPAGRARLPARGHRHRLQFAPPFRPLRRERRRRTRRGPSSRRSPTPGTSSGKANGRAPSIPSPGTRPSYFPAALEAPRGVGEAGPHRGGRRRSPTASRPSSCPGTPRSTSA